MSDFASHQKQAEATLHEAGIHIILKSTRVGATIGEATACINLRLKTIVVTSSTELIDGIRKQLLKTAKFKPRIMVIADNTKLCRRLNVRPKLRFQLKKSCTRCEFNQRPDYCLYQRLLTSEVDLLLATYRKIEILMRTHSRLLQVIRKCKVAILDETSTRLLEVPPTVQFSKTENGKTLKTSALIEQEFPSEKAHYEQMMKTFEYSDDKQKMRFVRFWWALESTLLRIEDIEKPGKHENRIDDTVEPADFVQFWKYITTLDEEGKDTTLLQQCFPLMLSKEIFISFNNGVVLATPVEDMLIHLREFCDLFQKGTVLLIDACHMELNYDAIFGSKVKPVAWNDPHCTDEKQLVICDRHHSNVKFFLSSGTLQKYFESTIRSFAFDPDETFVVCLNKVSAEIVSSWNVGQTTWHRSSKTRGIQAEGRDKMFLVLGPYVPVNSFDILAISWPDEYFLENFENLNNDEKIRAKSVILKRNYEAGELINCLGRVKDFLGKKRSLVVCIGITLLDFEILKQRMPSNWPSPSRPKRVQPVMKGGLSRDGPWIAHLWFDEAQVEVKDLAIVARIIRYTKQLKKCVPSQILVGETGRNMVKAAALKYQYVLEKYNINLMFRTGGLSLAEAR